MYQIDIIEVIQQNIENVLFKAWKHDGCIDFFNGGEIQFEVDGKKYILSLEEIKDGK